MKPRGAVLAEASFDPKLRVYLLLQGAGILAGSIVGIPLVPFWLVLGRAWARRHYERLSCTLTDRALILKKGVWFRSETTVPLDRIQDVSVRHGPILDRLGIATMRVETAGSGSGGTTGINLTGVVDTPAFRDRVLQARDRASGWIDDSDGEEVAALPRARERPAGPEGGDADGLLRDIRDALGRIESLLEDRLRR